MTSESEVAQSCLTLSDSMDCSLPGFSVHGIFQAGVLEWVPLNVFVKSPADLVVVLLCIYTYFMLNFDDTDLHTYLKLIFANNLLHCKLSLWQLVTDSLFTMNKILIDTICFS